MTAVIAPSRNGIPALHVMAVVIGNGLEFYDFLSYAIFAVYIGKTFFPSHDAGANLIFSLATFGIGFITRPIGGIVLGSLGDRIGRKPAMILSFVLMGTGMLGVALTPGYAQIGIVAPILLVGFRLIQGFALGGEVGPNTAYLIEAAPPARRGFYGSMQYASQNTATLLAAAIGLALSSILSAHNLESWGWRIAFLLGVVIVPFGILIRRRLPETLHAADDAALAPDATTGTLEANRRIRPYAALIVVSFILLIGATIGGYVVNYMTSYALNTLRLSAGLAFGVVLVTSLSGLVADCVGGALSDIYGRKPLMTRAGILLFVLVIPVFWTITHFHSVVLFYLLMAAISILLELSTVPVLISLTETLPPHIRSGVVATVYAFAISIFGGSTQFVISWLIRATGSPLAPAFYWSAAIFLFLLAAFALPESSPVKLRAVAPDYRTAPAAA
jgi:MFS family permease